ncbi:conserved hypothetical protein [Cupriavidus necator]|uniref:Uncharacterized protein n=1 Tax=Cupriavidus necator TaxID=106590 RepID=A0A1K0JTS3_CUPNE|nr:conserved hypothetical protein [Cupriavidus necator]
MSKTYISAADAAKLLPRGKKVHTFFRVFGWMGATVERSTVLAAFEKARQVEVSPEAACFGHQLAVKLDGMLTYIDTNQQALRKLVPQAVAA